MTNFIIKSKLKDKYSTIPNALIQNFILSLDARGLLVYLLSLPADWKINIKDLCTKNKVGENKMRKMINELIKFHYVVRKESKNSNGTYKSFDYFVYDTPKTLEIRPVDDFPHVDNPLVDIEGTYKVNNIQSKHNIYTQEFNLFWSVCRRKKSKDKTYKKFQEIIKKVDHKLLIEKMNHYNNEQEELKTEIKFYRHPYTWLNQKGWEDEYIAEEKTKEPSRIDILKSRIHKTKFGHVLEDKDKQEAIKLGLLDG